MAFDQRSEGSEDMVLADTEEKDILAEEIASARALGENRLMSELEQVTRE